MIAGQGTDLRGVELAGPFESVRRAIEAQTDGEVEVEAPLLIRREGPGLDLNAPAMRVD